MFEFKLQNFSQFPIVLFVGEMSVQYEELLSQIRQEIKKNNPHFEEIKCEAAQTPVEFVQESMLSFALFSSYKLICLNDAQKWNLKKWEEVQKKIPLETSAVLLLQYAKKEKLSEIKKLFSERLQIFEEQKIYARQIPGLLERYLKQRKMNMTSEALLFLIHQIGEDLSLLKLAVDRLEIDLAHMSKIDVADLQFMFEENKMINLFDCFSAGAHLNLAELFKKADVLMRQGESSLALFSQALRYYRVLGKLKYALQKKIAPAEIQKKIGLPTFIIDQYKTAAQNISWPHWMKNYERLAGADIALKSSSLSDEQILKNLFFEMEGLSHPIQG